MMVSVPKRLLQSAPLLAAFSAALVLPGCGDGVLVTRGFGSRQVVQIRDATIRFLGGAGNILIYVSGVDGFNNGTPRFWSINVETAEVREHDSTLSDLPATDPRGSGSGNGRFRCTWGLSTTGEGQLIVTDTQTNQQVVVDRIHRIGPGCPTESDPTLTLWRVDDAGRPTLWSGTFDAIRPARLDVDLTVTEVVTFGNGMTHVLAATPDEPDAMGLYSIDLSSFAVTVVIPAALTSGAWARGTTPVGSGSLGSSTLIDSATLSGIPSEPAGPFAGHFLYQRAMSDGGATLFVGPFASGAASELALFPLEASVWPIRIQISWSSGAGSLPPPAIAAWRRYDYRNASRFLHLWDDTRQQLMTCPLAGAPEIVGGSTPDGRHVLFAPRPYNPQTNISQDPGPVLLVSPELAEIDGSGACTDLATTGATAGSLSPDGTAMFWLVVPSVGADAQLWTAASDGSARRLLGTGAIAGPPEAPHFIGASQLELTLAQDLVWLDVHDDPVRMHYIAEKVFGAVIDLGHWLVTGYDHSDRDASGRLGVVNRDTGEKRLISPDVAKYTSPEQNPYFQVALQPDGVVRVLYLVRGRNPSPQDGLWVATVNGADLP